MQVGSMPVKLLDRCVLASHLLDRELMAVALGIKDMKMEQQEASC